MSLAGLLAADELPARVEASGVESDRFGVSLGRVEIGPDSKATAADVVDLVERAGLDVVVVRYPADRVTWSAGFVAAGEPLVLHADTIVYWELKPLAPTTSPGRVAFRVATAGERGIVHDLARSAFADYGSHYRANPRFDPTQIALGYAEWASAQVEAATSCVLVVEQQGTDTAFVAMDRAGERTEITLSGVPQWARGRGAYRASMAVAEAFAAGRGDDSVVISTQVHNTVVQRVWAARGYLPVHAFETVHFVRPELVSQWGSRA